MIAYFDCFSGISGDMTLGAFIDLGVPVQWLCQQLERMPLTGFDLSVSEVLRNGIRAQRVKVETLDHEHSRNYTDIRSLILGSPLSSEVQKTSLSIFEKIADAEARIHNCPKESVHFHEIGGIDAIVDIVGTALCVEYLNIDNILASKIPLGSGFVACRHGTLPVPAPATLDILKGVPVYGTDLAHELVTPTGAAIIVTLAHSFGKMPDVVIKNTGYGAGKHVFESIPNMLRIITGTLSEPQKDVGGGLQSDEIVIVETCIDDMNPEIFGFLMERLFEDGALDVYWIPVYMKKNRPGTMVQVLCRGNHKETVVRRLLTETTSAGVRFYDAHRRILAREQMVVDSAYGKVQVKRMVDPDGGVRMVPEFESCKKIALEKNIPLRVVYDIINRSLHSSSS